MLRNSFIRSLRKSKHVHRSEDGKTISPVIEITGYPAPQPAGN
jgi:hypothetical protein